jgi:prepilin-type N-terminal cleavage/methylation domain-containing protein/prepilin-type processing-associated H-X9-DG protein
MNPPRRPTFVKACEDGFTLVELLVVLATVAIMAALLLPAIAGTKPNSQAFQCLENQRQLTIGWQMYAEDNNGKLVFNGGAFGGTGFTPPTPTDPRLQPGGAWYQWCPGDMSSFSLYATNFIQAGAIYSYVNSMSVYHCAADHNGYKFGPLVFSHPRSYSMNCYLSPIAGGEWHTGEGTVNFYKDTSFTRPGPALTFVLIDENEYSINDAFFVSDPAQGNAWQDIPASRHDGGCVLSYADGHSEMKRWTDTKILNYKGTFGGLILGDPNSGDAAWLQARATFLTK